MSVLALTRLARDLEHEPGLLDEFLAGPRPVLARYDVSDEEQGWVLDLDAQALLDHGMNAVALRNLLVLLGIPHAAMYTHGESLRTT